MGFKKGLASFIFIAAGASTAHAGSFECVKDSVVLRNRHHNPQRQEAAAVKDLLEVRSTGVRSFSGLNKFKLKDAGKRAVCETASNPCFKLMRNARKTGFSHYRRAAQHFCSPNYIVTADASKRAARPLTTDSLIRYQTRDWKLIQAPSAWQRSHGDYRVAVAVIDTGVDYTHPDVGPNVLAGYGRDFSGDTTGTDAMDDNGHGTHVAGTIGALGDNGQGLAGVAWDVRIIPLKFLDANGSGTLSGAVRAIEYMVQLKEETGVNIIAANNSWGGGGYSSPLESAIRSANDAGIIFVAAAGNEANDNDDSPSYPASYAVPNVVSVAAVDSFDGTLAYFSNYGASSVHIAAPGVDIASTYPGNQYAKLSGTSMAAPHVTGALALLKSYSSYLDKDGLINRLLSTAKYNRELRSSVAGGRMLNLRNMMINNTSQAAPARRKSR